MQQSNSNPNPNPLAIRTQNIIYNTSTRSPTLSSIITTTKCILMNAELDIIIYVQTNNQFNEYYIYEQLHSTLYVIILDMYIVNLLIGYLFITYTFGV